MTVTWIEDAPSSFGGGAQWLGFGESTTAECEKSKVNQNACYYACALSGSAGWNLLLVPICQSICITEACASGILVSHPQMEKASVTISPCFNACMDAFQQEAVGTDEAALKVAAQQCASKCGFAQTLKNTPGATKVTKAGGGAKAPSQPSSPSAPSAPSAPAASRAGAGSGGLLVAALVVAGVAALAIGAAR